MILTSSLLSVPVWSGSRQEAEDYKLDREVRKSHSTIGSYEQKQRENVLRIADELGFYHTNNERVTYPDESLESAVVNGVIATFTNNVDSHNYVLVFKVLCTEPEMLFPISVRGIPFTWVLPGKKFKGHMLSGAGQITDNGIGRVSFTYSETILSGIMEFKFGSISRKINLVSGPYEISLPLSACKRK